MKKIQEKSPCCRGNIWSRGKRRRQCSICKKSWRGWKKKRGRKKRRTNKELLFQYFKKEKGSMSNQARKKGMTPAAMHSRMNKTVKSFNQKTPWPKAPSGDIIAVADAMVEYIDGVRHIIYFIFLRSSTSNQAIIMPFFVSVGHGEGLQGWRAAFEQIPQEVQHRIRVVVCDGIVALSRIARDNGWILQRCHFHLRAQLVHYCSPRRFGRRPKFSKQVLRLANIILKTKDEEALIEAIKELRIIKDTITAPSFRTVVSGFIKHYEDYRPYLNYPEYNLPTTSNTAEHFIGHIRDLQYRAKGFRSINSLSAWIEAYSKYKEKVTCNGKISAPN